MPDTSVGDVVSRNTFRKCQLYASFVDLRTRQAIQQAKTDVGLEAEGSLIEQADALLVELTPR